MSPPNRSAERVTRADLAPLATKADVEALRTELEAKLASKVELEALRTELKAELASKADLEASRAETKAEFAAVRTELATKADKADLEALRAETKAEFAAVRTELKAEGAFLRNAIRDGVEGVRAEMRAEFASVRAELANRPTHEDLARHANAILDAIRVHISGIDDKYADLPGRVSALEASR